jgi:hypothetical protein
MMAELVRELETHAARLTARGVSEMYRDPFWNARFGEHGRKFSEEDGLLHKIFDPALAERFLQQVLFPEGARA